MMNSIQVQTKSFQELKSLELYDILALRQAVFCVEQECVYLDSDHQDIDAKHVLIRKDGHIAAYARIIQKNTNYFSIGRVVVKQEFRKFGLATTLMNNCISTINTHPDAKIIISAQSYLKDFYQKFGFKNTGKYYLEDDIPHEEMIYTP